jgi:molybdopterin molybdotransferase
MSSQVQTLSCDSPALTQGLLTVEKALSVIFDSIKPVAETELVELSKLVNRVLAEDISSPINVPPFDNSAMDGYAVRSEDFSENAEVKHFVIVGTAFAGEPFQGKISEYECVRIMTGGALPKGADAVIMQENAERDTRSENKVSFTSIPKSGLAVRRVGEDIAENSLVFHKGHLIKPIDLGLLASLGIEKAKVYRKIKVGIVSTGDELVQPGSMLKAGEIYDSNRFVLEALLLDKGFDVQNYGVLKDDKDLIKTCFLKASKEVDVLLSSGGVSGGEADYTKDVLKELGTVGFWKIAMKPGKPLAFGQLGKAHFIGLPGNPVSSVVTFQQIALAALRHLSGSLNTAIATHKAVLAETFYKRAGRTDFQRGIAYTNDKGELLVKPMPKQNSGILSSIAFANCYVILPKDNGKMEAGEIVSIQLFSDI